MGNAWCDMHRIDEAEAFFDAALADEVFDCVGDVDESAAAFDFEPEVFGERFHGGRLAVAQGTGKGKNSACRRSGNCW
jgi:hypothetical protein